MNTNPRTKATSMPTSIPSTSVFESHSKSLSIQAKTIDDIDFNLSLEMVPQSPQSPQASQSPPSLQKSPPALQETRSQNSVRFTLPEDHKPKPKRNKYSKNRVKIFNIFSSPQSEPPPLPPVQRSAPVTLDRNKTKKRRSFSISRSRQNKVEAKSNSTSNLKGRHIRRESKFKSILSNIFPKKTVNKNKKRSRTISFSLRKNKKKKDSITNSNEESLNDSEYSKTPKLSRGNKKRKQGKSSENINTNINKKGNHKKGKKGKHKKHHSCNNINMLDVVENMDWMDKFDEDGIDIGSDIEYEPSEFNDEEVNRRRAHYRQESPFQSEVRRIKQDMMKSLLDEIGEEEEAKGIQKIDHELSISETEEYKDDFHDSNQASFRKRLAPKSSSFRMRSFEKRPEYTTYYPPASLMEVFSNS